MFGQKYGKRKKQYLKNLSSGEIVSREGDREERLQIGSSRRNREISHVCYYACFLNFFLQKKNRLICSDKSSYQKLAAKIKAFQSAFEVQLHVPTVLKDAIEYSLLGRLGSTCIFASSDLFTYTHMYANKMNYEFLFNLLCCLTLVFVVCIRQTVSFHMILFRRNTAQRYFGA